MPRQGDHSSCGAYHLARLASHLDHAVLRSSQIKSGSGKKQDSEERAQDKPHVELSDWACRWICVVAAFSSRYFAHTVHMGCRHWWREAQEIQEEGC